MTQNKLRVKGVNTGVPQSLFNLVIHDRDENGNLANKFVKLYLSSGGFVREDNNNRTYMYGDLYASGVTDSNGYITFSNLPIGGSGMKGEKTSMKSSSEVNGPKPASKGNNWTFEVYDSSDDTGNVVWTDSFVTPNSSVSNNGDSITFERPIPELFNFEITITEDGIDKTTPGLPIEGLEVTMREASKRKGDQGRILGTFTTDENGLLSGSVMTIISTSYFISCDVTYPSNVEKYKLSNNMFRIFTVDPYGGTYNPYVKTFTVGKNVIKDMLFNLNFGYKSLSSPISGITVSVVNNNWSWINDDPSSTVTDPITVLGVTDENGNLTTTTPYHTFTDNVTLIYTAPDGSNYGYQKYNVIAPNNLEVDVNTGYMTYSNDVLFNDLPKITMVTEKGPGEKIGLYAQSNTGYIKVTLWDGYEEVVSSNNWYLRTIPSDDVSTNRVIEIIPCDSNGNQMGHIIGINVSGNKLTSLDVTSLVSLNYLYCHSNNLSSLDLSYNNNLNYLNCQSNMLTTLNISGLTNLTFLVADNNRFVNSVDLIGLSTLSNLYSLNLSYNKLKTLDVTNLTNLGELRIGYNRFTPSTLDSILNNLASVTTRQYGYLWSNLGIRTSDSDVAYNDLLNNKYWSLQNSFEANPFNLLFDMNFVDKSNSSLSGITVSVVDGNYESVENISGIGNTITTIGVSDENGQLLTTVPYETYYGGVTVIVETPNNTGYYQKFKYIDFTTLPNDSVVGEYGVTKTYHKDMLISDNAIVTVTTDLQNGMLTHINAATNGYYKVTYWDGYSEILNSNNTHSRYIPSDDASTNRVIEIIPCDSTGNENGKISMLWVQGVEATSIDVSSSYALYYLDLYNNKINSFNDIIGLSNVDLQVLQVSRNILTSVDGALLPKELITLYLDDNSVNNQNITGLNDLNRLTTISLQNNNLTSLDCDLLPPGINTLTLWGNSITSDSSLINLSGLTSLTVLNLGNNQITSFDCNVLPLSLNNLSFYANGITSQDDLIGIDSLVNLQVLDLGGNQITSFSTSGLSQTFHVLSFINNQLSSLDVSNLTNLEWLYAYNNQLTSVNVSGLSKLNGLHLAGNQLESLDLSGLSNLSTLIIESNYFNSSSVDSILNTLNSVTSRTNGYLRGNLSIRTSDSDVAYNDLLNNKYWSLQNV